MICIETKEKKECVQTVINVNKGNSLLILKQGIIK